MSGFTGINLGDVIQSGASTAEGIIGGFVSANQSRLQYERNQYLLNRTHELNEQSAQAAYERELEADSTKYQRQVADLKAAGLNPMLATGQAAGSVSSSAASVGTPSSGIAHMPSVNLGDIMAMRQLKIQERLADSQIDLQKSQAAKNRADAEGKEIENWIQENSKDIQIESMKLENLLKEGKISLTQKEIDKCSEEIKKVIEETKSEIEKQGLMLAQKALAKANEKQILELLPYEKKLKAAQAQEARAAAALALVHKAYQQGLIEDGYLDAFIKEQKAKQSSAESEAAVDALHGAIQSGDWSKVPNAYIPVISECLTGISNAFGIVGSIFHGIVRL